jgi:hypothetical protein
MRVSPVPGDATMSIRLLDTRMLWLLSACAFASMASMRICDAMLPLLAAEFSATTGQAARTISGFALAYGVLQLFYGPLGDRYGKVRVIGFATLACTIGSTAAALSPTLDWLVVGRILSGVAAAGIIPLTMAWIGDSVAYEGRQEVLAKLLGATVFGMICGQWLGGLIAKGRRHRRALRGRRPSLQPLRPRAAAAVRRNRTGDHGRRLPGRRVRNDCVGTILAVDATGLHACRLWFLRLAQHAADPCDSNGSDDARYGGLAVCLRPVLRAVSWGLACRMGGRHLLVNHGLCIFSHWPLPARKCIRVLAPAAQSPTARGLTHV